MTAPYLTEHRAFIFFHLKQDFFFLYNSNHRKACPTFVVKNLIEAQCLFASSNIKGRTNSDLSVHTGFRDLTCYACVNQEG